MSNSTTPTDTASQTTLASASGGFTPITSQEALDKIVGERLGREKAKHQKELDTLRAQAEAEKGRNKDDVTSQLADLNQRLTESEKRAEAAEAKALRTSIAAEKGVPVGLLPETGTKEELEKAADDLLAWRGNAETTTGLGPGAVPTSGSGAGAPKASGVSAGRELYESKRKKTD